MIAIADTAYGPLAYDSRDPWIGKSLEALGEYNDGEIAAYRRYIREGDTAIDAGANIGATMLPLACLVGRLGTVIAVEPQLTAFEILCSNVTRNDLANVRTFRACVGAASGEVLVPDVFATNATLADAGGLRALDGSRNGVPTPIMTIDALGLDRCDFIKMDVEGAESAVLMGARETISKFRPIIYHEIHLDEHGLVPAILSAWGYRMWGHSPPLYRLDNRKGAADPWEDRYLSKNGGYFASINALALPVERFSEPPDLPYLKGQIHAPPFLNLRGI